MQKVGKRRLGAHSKNEDGPAVIEVAIAVFTLGMIELYIAFYSYSMISESAREATRYAIVRGATCQVRVSLQHSLRAQRLDADDEHFGDVHRSVS